MMAPKSMWLMGPSCQRNAPSSLSSRSRRLFPAPPRPPLPRAAAAASPRAAPAGPLQAATLSLSHRSRWPSFLPGRLPLRPPSPSAGIQLQLLLATASPPSPLLSCQSALTSFRADAVDRIYVGVAVAAVQVPRQLRHPPLPPAARARRRAGAGAASLPVADQRSACGSWWRRRKLLSIGQLSGGFPQLSSAPHGQLSGGFPQHRSPGFGHQPKPRALRQSDLERARNCAISLRQSRKGKKAASSGLLHTCQISPISLVLYHAH
ncbi:uncharacterized protein LOC120664021 isoform X1 [Panicum virgatum]|nr:uncharacterized protein LOC120664021 isoform X1 [Panicum virgatum]